MMVKKAAEYIAKSSLKEADNLIDTFNEKATNVCKMPGIGTPYKNGLRKIKLGKFRYNIFYKIMKEKISFVGIWHTRRGKEFEP